MTVLLAHLPEGVRPAVRWQVAQHGSDHLSVPELALLLGLTPVDVAGHVPGGQVARADLLALLHTPVPGDDRPCYGC
ncbi:hypothetical protein [Deinococcus radiotolerans]|uniref:Transcriptional regulator n=1 Tax=Deinococcus radiotolerans TaxID=1309407 RepID=A0ABQ2FQS4_9DEIO|nr:hypothetical protein [Deinococcus radiotolerans]GGL17756.1 hypothetical protein GCM10010844_40760 [Deinococcus radiotolerans]